MGYGIAYQVTRSTLLPLAVLIYSLVVLVCPLVVLIYSLVVLVCLLLVLFYSLVVLVCPLVVSVRALVVLVGPFFSLLVVLRELSVCLFISDHHYKKKRRKF